MPGVLTIAAQAIRRLLAVGLAACIMLGCPSFARGQLEPPFTDAPSPIPPDGLAGDVVAPLPRTEKQQDALDAAAHYLQGRLHSQRHEDAAALRHYQRAWRCDPERESILREIVPLAFELGRGDEAARYAVIAAERDPRDVVLLRRLAAYLAQQREWPRAQQMYARAWELDAKNRAADAPLDEAAVKLLIEMAQLCFLTDDFPTAAKHLANVRAALDDPRSPLTADQKRNLLDKPEKTYAIWGETFLRAQRYDEAVECFQESRAAGLSAPLLAFHLSRVAAGRGERDAALAQLAEYFAAKETAAGGEAVELLGELIRSQAGDEKQADAALIERLRQLVKDDPANARLQFALAGQLDRAGEFQEAAGLYAAAARTLPLSDGLARWAAMEQRRGDAAGMLAALASASAKLGGLEKLELSVARIAADKPLCAQLFELARQRQKKSESAEGELIATALLAAQAKDFAVAEEFFALAAEAKEADRGQSLLAWAMAMLSEEEYERAAKVFQRIVDEKLDVGGKGAADYYLAGALSLGGKADAAVDAMRRAIAAAPDNIGYSMRLGMVQFRAQRFEEAEQTYLKILDRHDGNHRSPAIRRTLRDVRLALSNVDLKQNDLPAAVEWLQQVLDEFPEDTSARNDLGYIWVERGLHLQRSLAMIERAVAAEPSNRAYRDSLGWAYYQLGRYADAVRELSQAASDPEADGVILDHLGDAYHRLNNENEARAAWQRALAIFERKGDADKLAATKQKLTGSM